ncbi:hypothetical protein AMECASPLE_029479 [Ameca splendens]|uniref:Uncharacterized protein n=1 Tax=Ameca splendens TaxID=208324 RepID=A0ABV1ACN1_9TELE
MSRLEFPNSLEHDTSENGDQKGSTTSFSEGCCFSPFPSIYHPGAWLDSLGTDVNRLCLRKSQTQNVSK